uniref:Uncharacterized protein n=1 Tax=Arundo donax TaxID=35708 RepID=A0A0A9FJJ9_ARUDO
MPVSWIPYKYPSTYMVHARQLYKSLQLIISGWAENLKAERCIMLHSDDVL